MPETLKIPDTPEERPTTSVVTLVVAAVVVLATAASLWFLFEPVQSKRPPDRGTASSKMGDAEREYVKNLRFENIGLSRAENFLHQEVTTLNGEVVNRGTEPVQGLIVTTEFLDDLNQVVLRETRGVLGKPAVALAPGERRTFEISFEHVPISWNRQQPSLRVVSFQIPPKK